MWKDIQNYSLTVMFRGTPYMWLSGGGGVRVQDRIKFVAL